MTAVSLEEIDLLETRSTTSLETCLFLFSKLLYMEKCIVSKLLYMDYLTFVMCPKNNLVPE